MPSSLFWLPGVYSWVRQGFRRTPLYPPLPIGIWWECSVSQRWGGGEPLFYLVQMPHQLSRRERERERDELLIWRSQLSSQKSLSNPLQTTGKCHVRNLLFQSIRPRLCCPAKVFCKVEAGSSFSVESFRSKTGKSSKKILKRSLAFTVQVVFCFFYTNGSTFGVMTRRNQEL